MPLHSRAAGPAPLRVLHLGLGAFHRAHQAVFMQRLHDRGDRRWVLAAGNIRDDDGPVVAALHRCHGRYTLETVAPDGARTWCRIEALGEVVPYTADLSGLVALAADPATRIISCTVTESGHGLDAHGALAAGTAAVRTDIAALRDGRPVRTLHGVLARLLAARRAAAAGPVTLLCCDNIRHGGQHMRAALLEFLALAGEPALRDWVGANTCSPDGMVDRITPRPDAGVRARALAATGSDDPAAVMSEAWLQWVLEDRFIAGRPHWEAAGVELVADGASVTAHEEAKIRILNGAHSGIAWAGALRGHRTIDAAIADPRIRWLVREHMMEVAIPCLRARAAGGGPDLPAYADAVLERFGNAALGDTVERVAADSLHKLAGFVAPNVHDLHTAGAGLDRAARLPVLLLLFLRRHLRGGLPFTLRDPALGAAAVADLVQADDPVAAFAGLAPLWGRLAHDPLLLAGLRRAVAEVVRRLDLPPDDRL